MNKLLFILLIGIGATITMDLWSIVRKTLLGVPHPNYSMVGRWVIYMPYGKFYHNPIAESSPMRGEHIIGWVLHYLIGIAFAALLVGLWGDSWIHNPTIAPAFAIGIATVSAPFLLMQPGMGAGIAASRIPKPNLARLHSLITHAIFGIGLYLSAAAINVFCSN